MKGTDPQHGYNHRREWSLILMLMLLAVLLMFSVSQRALAMQAAWQVNADMISLINPDGTIAAYIGEGQVEPVAQQILTPLSFNYLTPVPPGASVISTNTAIIHVTIPSMTPTLAPTERPTNRPPDAADPTTLISALTPTQAEEMIVNDQLGGGMVPKVAACVTALRGGVRRAHILNGTVPHTLLLEVYTDEGVGTMITDDSEES